MEWPAGTRIAQREFSIPCPPAELREPGTAVREDRGMEHDLIRRVETLGHPRILVVGDLILDRYVWGDAERISQEAPVILLHEDRQELGLGGGANVAPLPRG